MYTELVEGELHKVTYDERRLKAGYYEDYLYGNSDFAVAPLVALAENGYESGGCDHTAGQTEGQRQNYDAYSCKKKKH